MPEKVHKHKHPKLAALPPNARIEKRPLLRPAIPSPHTSAQKEKIVYVSAKTPFLSAVKRVEKLLRLSENRLVQSARTLAQQNQRKGHKRKLGEGEDEITGIVRALEQRKSKRSKHHDGGEGREEVVVKGTGKAIDKVLQMGLWFQQRQEYVVRLRTGTVSAIDDIAVQVEGTSSDHGASEKVGDAMDAVATEAGIEEHDTTVQMETDLEKEAPTGGGDSTKPFADPKDAPGPTARKGSKDLLQKKDDLRRDGVGPPDESYPETRIRQLSVLEVAVSLK